MDFTAILKSEKARAAMMQAALKKDDPRSLLHSSPSQKTAATTNTTELVDLGRGVSYLNAFLTAEEGQDLVKAIDRVPVTDWATLTRRRLLNLGGVPHPSGSWAEPLPDEICSLTLFRLQRLGLFSADAPANQVLLNEYIDGEGIQPHKDGPLFDPLACIVSLGGDAVLHFYAPSAPKEDKPVFSEDKPVFSVVLRANSLVTFSGEAYSVLTHGINSSETDAVATSTLNLAEARVTPGEVLHRPSRRLSLTLRRLARVERSFAPYDYIPPDIKSERARRRAWWLSSISEK